MVMFVFVVMMLNLGAAAVEQEKRWLQPRVLVGPGVLSGVLLVELCHVVWPGGPGGHPLSGATIDATAVGIALFGPYLLAVELASMMLLAALVAAFHLGRHD
jgi:NADH-quinone oxidoreductase subunit J